MKISNIIIGPMFVLAMVLTGMFLFPFLCLSMFVGIGLTGLLTEIKQATLRVWNSDWQS